MNPFPKQILSFDLKPIDFERKLGEIGRIILVGSGKGGVGKSFISCGIALKFAEGGKRVGLLDIDLHGASLPSYLGLKPPVRSTKMGLEPKRKSKNLKVMSVALLTGNLPVPIRGKEKNDAILQLFSLTNWGKLDFLIVDLPPGTGDELLSAFSLFRREKSSLVLVTTPSINASLIVSRLGALARAEGVPISGIVVNMAFSNSGGLVEYPFGKLDRKSIERTLDSQVLVEIPLDPRVNNQPIQDVILGKSDISKRFKDLIDALQTTICR